MAKSPSTTPQQGGTSTPPQQQGQQAPAPTQQQGGQPIYRDWAAF